ncbi:MAG: sulfatase-like hydrolase/transferase [Acidobacteria bacterium]|nr:sulfatase-like hydrolase/transferase [Acidobacteriota bacterium]
MPRLASLALLLCGLLVPLAAQDRPNILWITAEDHGPQMGAYGDAYATTPNVDALAAKGMLYRNAWSTAPVCAPARTTIISGMYPPSIGGQHMRSMTRLPSSMLMYPQYLREAGYYVTNNSKTDYNLEEQGQVWDESSPKAHWKNRKKDQPFFAIFNTTISHESKLRTRPHQQVHDPAGVRVPAYHPDTPEVRQDWAQYYDRVTEADAYAGEHMREIEEAGLADNTIIFYYADHGSGMPRSKRWPYNSGLQVPMVVYFPEKWKDLAPPEYRPGSESYRLVGFVDLASTLLSMAGIEPPKHMQGHAFAGKYVTPEPRFMFGFRGRMDERYDFVRSVRDQRYIYIRNFKPHRIYGQYIDYMFQTPTTKVWFNLYSSGRANGAQSAFWQEKPTEELYDLFADPDEVNNLAGSPAHKAVRDRLNGALRDWQARIRDLGFLPEGEMHERAQAARSTPYDMGHDDYRYDFERIRRMAEIASDRSFEDDAPIRRGFHDRDSAVRYWAATAALIRGKKQDIDSPRNPVFRFRRELHEALHDDSPYVRAVAGEVLGRFGDDQEASMALETLMQLASVEKNGLYVSLEALNAIDYMDQRAAPAKDRIAALPKVSTSGPGVKGRMGGYVGNVIDKILADLK